MRSLFPKKVSVQDIEREVTEELETMVRSGKNPPPESWTLLGGLYGKEPGADEPAPAPPTESAVEEEPAAPPAEPPVADEAEAPARPARAKAGSSRARSAGAKSGGSRTARTASGTRSRRSTTGSARGGGS